jgi:Leucine-rich repeat (LRR) protein
MKTLRNFLIPALLVMAGLFYGCNAVLGARTEIIHIEGVTWACNITTSYAVFGSTIENENEKVVQLSASKGDLLYMMLNDQQFYYRYNPGKGNQLKVTFDTVNTVVAYLNGAPEYLELTGPKSLTELNKLSNAEIERLSTLYIKGPITDELLSTLKHHVTALSGIGLILEDGAGSGELADLLSICHPRLLVMDESWSLPVPDDYSALSNLELLWIQGKGSGFSNMARGCRNLESLIIEGWEPETESTMPLSGLRKLQCLTVAESRMTSLSDIAFPSSIRHLFMINCDTLSDISAIADLPGLRRLSLTGCDMVEDPGVLKNQGSLTWLSFPPNITHTEFMEITAHLKKLQVAEMIECSGIENLAPLQSMSKLRILVLKLEKEQLSMLASLDQLKMIVLANELFEADPQWIKELRLALPECKIVPGSGICLGSGWMLLLFPFVLLFRLLFRHKK